LKPLKTSHTYLAFRGVMAFANALMFTTYAVYYINALHLNPFQLLLIGTILEVTVFLFENITGIVADTYSRRLSVLLGCFVLGAAYLLEGSIPGLAALIIAPFIWLAIAECIRGVGETFLSGAATAWVTDELGGDGIGKLFVRAGQVRIIARIAGAGASIGLASLSLNLPFLFGGAIFLALGFFLVKTMKENAFTPVNAEENNSAIQAMFTTTTTTLKMLKARPVLLAVVGVSLFTGAASEGIDRLWEAHFIKSIHFPAFGDLGPVVWIGLISVGAEFITLFISEAYNRLFDADKQHVIKTGLFILTFFQIIGVAIFALAGHFWLALAGYLFFMVARTLSGPLYSAWINSNIDSRVRASILSIDSQANALGQTAIGPAVGFIGSRYTTRAAILTSSILLVPTFGLFAKIWKRSKRQLKQVG
jgi:MFS family permease